MTDDISATDAWRAFCERLGEVGERLTAEPFPASETDRANCVRHLTRQLVMALQGELEHGDPAHPTFIDTKSRGCNGVARTPTTCTRVPRSTPRPRTACRATSPACARRSSPSSTATCISASSACSASARSRDLARRTRRRVRAVDLARPPTHDRAQLDRVASRRAPVPRSSVRVRLGTRPCRDTDDRAHRHAWDTAGGADRTRARRPRSIARPPGSSDRSSSGATTWRRHGGGSRAMRSGRPPHRAGGAPTIGYGAGWWDLAPDEALLITTDVPDADYWGWTVHHRYRLDSGDFARRQTSLNMTQAFADADGRLRFVLAADRSRRSRTGSTPKATPKGWSCIARSAPAPGRYPRRGSYRWRALRDHLPPTHPVVDENARREQLARRSAALLARYV